MQDTLSIGAAPSHWTLRRRLAALGLAALSTFFLLLPCLCIRPVSSPAQDSTPSSTTGITLFAVPSLEEGEKEQGQQNRTLRNIYAWAELKDPLVLLQPDLRMGFSSVLSRPSYPFFHFTAMDWRVSPIGESTLLNSAALPPTAGRQPFSSDWAPYSALPLPAMPDCTPPKGIHWLDERGRRLLNSPVMDAQQLRPLCPPGQLPKHTMLEVQAGQTARSFRVVVRESCGIVALDKAAVQALRGNLYENRLSISTPMQFTVVWHL